MPHSHQAWLIYKGSNVQSALLPWVTWLRGADEKIISAAELHCDRVPAGGRPAPAARRHRRPGPSTTL